MCITDLHFDLIHRGSYYNNEEKKQTYEPTEEELESVSE